MISRRFKFEKRVSESSSSILLVERVNKRKFKFFRRFNDEKSYLDSLFLI